jgi:hypothetical protein
MIHASNRIRVGVFKEMAAATYVSVRIAALISAALAEIGITDPSNVLSLNRLGPNRQQPIIRKSPFVRADPVVAVPDPPTSSSRRMLKSQEFDDITTPVNWRKLDSWLDGYDASLRSALVEGFRFGFAIQFTAPAFSLRSDNHLSTRQNIDALESFIHDEISSGRVAGPFASPPYDPFVVSPLGIVPKKEIGKFRVIHDLSFPEGGSVNSGIDAEAAAVNYETLDRVIELVQSAGRGALLAKVDIEHAFRIVPVRPTDRYLLGFAISGKYFFDKCLPMGCRSSCAVFERFSTALQWVAIEKLGIPFISHILDDFIFVGPPESRIASLALDAFLLFCAECGIPIKASKTVHPSSCVSAHGIELDTVAMQARLPQEKLDKARELLTLYANKSRIQLRDLQSLIGFLVFACRVVAPGRAFLVV